MSHDRRREKLVGSGVPLGLMMAIVENVVTFGQAVQQEINSAGPLQEEKSVDPPYRARQLILGECINLYATFRDSGLIVLHVCEICEQCLGGASCCRNVEVERITAHRECNNLS